MKIFKTVPEQQIFFREESLAPGDAPSKTENQIVNVFDDAPRQTVLGFGGAFTEASAYNYHLLDDAGKQAFLQAYFHKEKGIGYNFGRTHIHSCDFALDIYTYVEEGDMTLETFDIARDKKYILPLLRDALAYTGDELFLFASPWSPPAYMKTNGSMVGGGSLRADCADLWALYYARYIQAFAAEGIQIAAISVQNEPIATQTWESCLYTAQDEADFIENHLAPTLDREGLSHVKLIIWDHNKERVYDRAKKTLESPAVRDRVWAVGHHWYSGDHFAAVRLVTEQLHKPTICTEFCRDLPADGYYLRIAEDYARELCGNFNSGNIASCDWNLLLDTNGGPYHNRKRNYTPDPTALESKVGGCAAPILLERQTGKLLLTPSYYYIGHFSKFVRRGAVVLPTTGYTQQLHTCAFRNPDGQLVLIAVNPTDAALPFVLRHRDCCTKVSLEAHSMATILF